MILKIKKRYFVLILIAILIIVTAIIFFKSSKHSEPKRNYEPPPPLLSPNTAVGVKIKKTFGDIKLEVSAGVIRPNRVIPTNILEYALIDKGYKLKLKNVSVNLKDKDKSIELEADMALSNEEFSRMTIKGIWRLKQKGFKISDDTRAIKLTIRIDKVRVEKLM